MHRKGGVSRQRRHVVRKQPRRVDDVSRLHAFAVFGAHTEKAAEILNPGDLEAKAQLRAVVHRVAHCRHGKPIRANNARGGGIQRRHHVFGDMRLCFLQFFAVKDPQPLDPVFLTTGK